MTTAKRSIVLRTDIASLTRKESLEEFWGGG